MLCAMIWPHSCLQAGDASASDAAILITHGFVRLAQLLSDYPQIQAKLPKADAYQRCLQAQARAEQLLYTELLPVLLAQSVFGPGPAASKVSHSPAAHHLYSACP